MSTGRRWQARGRAADRRDEACGHRAEPRLRGHGAARRHPGAVTEGDDAGLGRRPAGFLHAPSPGTVANLAANPAVEVNVVDPIRRKGWRFAGRGTVHTGGPLFDEVLAWYDRPPTAPRPHAVVVIDVERAEELVSPAYDS